MKPAAFERLRARSVVEAAAALREAEGGAKLMAGGQSLGPMLNLRLVQPRLLVDIAGIAELTRVEEDAEGTRFGACITAADIEDGRAPAAGARMLPRIAGGIAYRAVRNRGTIGGSLCHGDPAADWISTLSALGAICIATNATGLQRRIRVHDFMTAAFENALLDDEVMQAVVIPRISKDARFGYNKICRRTGKFALAIGIVLFDPERDLFRAVIGATHGKPILVEDARELFGLNPVERFQLDQSMAVELLSRNGVEAGASRQLHLVALRRAAEEAFAK